MTIPDISTDRLVRALRITPRQAQWWHETKLVQPPIKGHNRSWDALRVIEAAAIAGLRKRGLSLQVVRRIVGKVRLALNESLEGVCAGGDVYLFAETRGRVVEISHSVAALVEFASDTPRAFVVVKISGEELRKAWFPHTAPTTRRHQ